MHSYSNPDLAFFQTKKKTIPKTFKMLRIQNQNGARYYKLALSNFE